MPTGSWLYALGQMLLGGWVLFPKSVEKRWWLNSQEAFQLIIVTSDTNREWAGRRAFENERKNRVIKKGCKIRRNDYIVFVELRIVPNLSVRG